MPAHAVTYSLGELAVRFGCELRGDPNFPVDCVASLSGGPSAIGFVVNGAYRDALRATRLAAVVVDAKFAPDCPTAALIHANPYATFARIAALLHPVRPLSPGVHATAVVDPAARLDATAEIGPFVVVEAGAQIGSHCLVGAHSVVGAGAVIGEGTRLLERTMVCAGTQIGCRCIVHPGAVIGSDGFGNARDGHEWIKLPQIGRVRIGSDVEIGANTTIDRGALGDTVIEDGVRLDNQIQIAHNVTIGAHTAVAACVGIAGSTRIGRRCMIGGGAGIGGQLVIGDDIIIAGFGMVTRSIDQPGMYSSVLPVEDVHLWRRLVGRFKRLDVLTARVRKLETATGKTTTGDGAGQDNDN
jgi:UDP-3-O-[3-hydroxymyristoyl] glucosamine N-acyltransferase